jgi:predicted Zn-dependent protease
MKKVFIQGLTIVALFFSSWLILNQIDWIHLFKIEQNTQETEKKLGELFLENFTTNESENKNTFLVTSIDSIANKICTANNIDRESLKIHIINKDDVNAFALPDGHLIIYSGLIIHSENPEALSGVICHEIVHIQKNHIMKKLVKEVGLSVLISLTTGNDSGKIISETARSLTSSAFDKNLEKEADLKAVDYLLEAQINPNPFADFLYQMFDNIENLEYNSWFGTHPDSKERANDVVEYSLNKSSEFKPVLSSSTWNQINEELQTNLDNELSN